MLIPMWVKVCYSKIKIKIMCLKIVLYVRVSLGIEMGMSRVNWNSTWILYMEILIF